MTRRGGGDQKRRTRVLEDESVVDLTGFEVGETRSVPRVEVSGSFQRYRRRLVALLIITDAACVAIALAAAHLLRFGTVVQPGYQLGVVVAMILWVSVFALLGLYAPHRLSAFEEFRRTVSAVGVGIVVLILLSFWLRVYLSRSWIALTAIIVLILELLGRRVVHLYENRLHARGAFIARTLVIGSERQAAQLVADLRSPGSGFLPLGDFETIDTDIADDGASPFERVERYRAALREHRADCVFVASPSITERQMEALVQAARRERVLVRVRTHLSGVLTSRLTVQPIGRDGVALTLSPAGLSERQRVLKHAMDLLCAGSALAIASPLFLLIALAIKLTSRGPVLFRQERVTEGGRVFGMYKFRTMTDGAERAAREQDIDTAVPYFKLSSDPRLTAVGRWLRRWSLDEMPQLLNVLRGDMSLVGPRPLPAEQVAANQELLAPRHEMRAGITGWWQVHGRADVSPEDAIRMDLFYIENWSLTLDLYVLLKTIKIVVGGEGAY